MKNLGSINKYFIKYKWRLLLGVVVVIISRYFAVWSARVIKDIIDSVQQLVVAFHDPANAANTAAIKNHIATTVFYGGMELLGLALLSGFFMFLSRQTLIVMSRLVEYDQKNEIYNHYQQLNTQFYKSHFTGDLMNRISEDVSRVRMYTGPSVMYFTSMLAIVILCVWQMISVNVVLTLGVLAPLPLLAITIYIVNRIIFKKSGKIQAQLSELTTTAQESYSAVRVIKSFVQENNMFRFFKDNSELYKDSSINLSLTEALYFPSMNFFVGISMICTVLLGGYFYMHNQITIGNIAEFVIYINLLMFPISSIGMVASMTQRAGASQKRIDEFLHTAPDIVTPANATTQKLQGAVTFNNISFVYPHTGIMALKNFSLAVSAGKKVAIIGKTGSGKSTLAHMLLRMYDTSDGEVLLDGTDIKKFNLHELRRQVSYAPQEAYLFSDTIYNNIKFGKDDASEAEVMEAARMADLDKDISTFANGYETMIGERGVMLSGGQKQRMVLARAILKNSKLLILDECLSAVDTQTEKTILANLTNYLKDKTTFVITHRIFTSWTFDIIIVLDNGTIAEQGTHDELMHLNGRYAKLYRHQTETATIESM